MSFIIWLIVGAIAGWIAGILTGSKRGLIADIVFGMIGSIVGGFIVVLLQSGNLDFTLAFTSFNLTSILVSTLGAVVLSILLRII